MAKKDKIDGTRGPAVRPVAKAILKVGLSIYDVAEEGVAEATERLRDLVAEVREEMNGGMKRKASLKKASSRRQRR